MERECWSVCAANRFCFRINSLIIE